MLGMAGCGPGGCGPGGCGVGGPGDGGPNPTEKQMVTHPAYVIEPPDILFIDAIRIVPKPPNRIEPQERVLRDPQVAVALAQFRGVQQTRGEHLVGQDGTITLGTYGCVNVTGLTICQAKAIIERHLSKYLLNPEVSLSVAAYNSKVFYIVIDGGGFGQQVFRFPITGNETVLDALAQINGLPPIASRKKMWLARPAPCDCKGCYQILPINWLAIVQGGDTCTNYQLFPGDRIYVRANCLLEINNYLGQFLAPIEQVFGAVLLGAGTVSAVRNVGSNNNNNGNGLGIIR
jgi:polysaccharide export outer membrane protein